MRDCLNKFIEFLNAHPCLVAANYLVSKLYVGEHFAVNNSISPVSYTVPVEDIGIQFDCNNSRVLEELTRAILDKKTDVHKTVRSVVENILKQYKIEIDDNDTVATAYEKCLAKYQGRQNTMEDDE